MSERFSLSLRGKEFYFWFEPSRSKKMFLGAGPKGLYLKFDPSLWDKAQIVKFVEANADFVERHGGSRMSGKERLDLSHEEAVQAWAGNDPKLTLFGHAFKVLLKEAGRGERAGLEIAGGFAEFRRNANKPLKPQLTGALCELAQKAAHPLAAEYCLRLGIDGPSSVKGRPLKGKWGQCNSKRVILIDPRSVFFPIEIFSHLVAHEVCHLVHMNHSKNFWNCLKALRPHAAGENDALDRWGKEIPLF